MSESMSESLFAAVTPAHGGDASERAALVRSLIADGADVSARDEQGVTPLHRSVKAPYSAADPLPSLEVIRALLECGADVHALDNRGATPAEWAVALNDSDPAAWAERSVEVLALLVEHGARLDGPLGTTGGSFAHHSCVAAPLYAFLLDHGAPTDAVNDRGNTPLHATVGSARPGLVKLLLERGADNAAVDGLGRTPLGIALRLPEYSMEQRQARSEIVTLLETAGARAHVRYPVVEGGPLPIDMEALRQAAGVMRAELAEVCEAAGIPDDSGRLAELVEPDFDSYQDLASALRHNCHPDLLPSVPRLCIRVLGESGTTRTLTGDQRLDTPFFHHGDLVVKGGDLDVGAPFVVTGSLTVEGVLADCGPDSVVAIGGGVTARGVFTDGEMSVDGDIGADVVYGYYNDQTLQAGTIRARLVIEDEHATIASVEAELHFDLDDFQQGYGDGVQEQLRELLVDEVFAVDEDEDEGKEMMDPHLLFARLREGLPVFRTAAQAEAH
ncbi:hypothetical protein AADR41_22825 [Streptomyces sp. CLV115]|uniref:ankyrin repeat domain-containing protein n=1 Tax=Streptomyces sp. CLV115 TaxID=3138502 RepID=UPI00313ADF02